MEEIIVVDTLGNVISTLFDHLLNSKHKPYISVLLYLISGIIGGICVVSNYTPFYCSSEFIDNVILMECLSDSQLIVQFPIWMIIIQIIHSVLQSILLNVFEVTTDNQKWFTRLFTIGDLIDLLCSIASLLFMASVFIQMYHTGSIYLSCNAKVIYIWVAYKFLAFMYARYANKNIEIIKNSIKKYP